MSSIEDYTDIELLKELLSRTDIRECDVYNGYSYEGFFDVDGTDVSIRFQEDAVEELEVIV